MTQLSSAIHFFPAVADMLPSLSSSTSMTSLTMFNNIWEPNSYLCWIAFTLTTNSTLVGCGIYHMCEIVSPQSTQKNLGDTKQIWGHLLSNSCYILMIKDWLCFTISQTTRKRRNTPKYLKIEFDTEDPSFVLHLT